MRPYIDVVGFALIAWGFLQTAPALFVGLAGLGYLAAGGAVVVTAAQQGHYGDIFGGVMFAVMGFVVGLLALALTLLGVATVASGFGILRRQPWARIGGIVTSALACMQCMPLGPVLGICSLLVLASADAAAEFEKPSDEVPAF